MDEITSCPKCHQPVTEINYFCPNCGKKIRSPPLTMTTNGLIWLAIKVLILPPFGLYWGYQYLRQGDDKSKLIGWLTIGVTIAETIWLIWSTIGMMNTVNQQVNLQMQQYGL